MHGPAWSDEEAKPISSMNAKGTAPADRRPSCASEHSRMVMVDSVLATVPTV
jgi:hypothetical protein